MAAHSIYINSLGYSQYGTWLILTTVIAFSQLGQLGVFAALTKTIAVSFAGGDRSAIKIYHSSAFLVAIFMSIVVGLLMLNLQKEIVDLFGLKAESKAIVQHLLPWVIVLSLYTFIVESSVATLNGLGRMDLSAGILLSSQILGLAISIWGLRNGFGINALLAGTIVTKTSQHFASYFGVCHTFGTWQLFSWPTVRSIRELLGLGSPLLIGTLINLLLVPFNKVVLSRVGGSGSVAVYEIAYSASMQLRNVFESGLRSLVPEVANHVASPEQLAAQVPIVARKAMQMILRFALPIFSAVFIGANIILQLWLRKALVPEQVVALRIMLVGAFASLIACVGYYILLALHQRLPIAMCYFIQASVNVAAVCIFISTNIGALSPIKVTIATAIGLFSTAVYLMFALQKQQISLENTKYKLSVERLVG